MKFTDFVDMFEANKQYLRIEETRKYYFEKVYLEEALDTKTVNACLSTCCCCFISYKNKQSLENRLQ